MQNISTVLVELGRDRIAGYKPAQNVGANVARSIRRALDTSSILTLEDFAPTADEATLEQRATKLERRPILDVPPGIKEPVQIQSSGNSYVRDPVLRAWVRQQAKGRCEGCRNPAPFEKDGRPFLEVHHVKHLAQDGTDLWTNVVALCPNCHQRCHNSSDKDEFKESLYLNIDRLIRE
jgi:5-methylcytosine-specific restriction protein A